MHDASERECRRGRMAEPSAVATFQESPVDSGWSTARRLPERSSEVRVE